MSYSIFADESGIDSKHKCYSIGGIVLRNNYLNNFNENFQALKDKHGIADEIKWKKISKSHGLINFGIDIINEILDRKIRFGIIVVKKDIYRHWKNNKERGFYVTYSLLIKNFIEHTNNKHKVFIDHRDDKYGKHDEALLKITNRMLKEESIIQISKNDSKLCPAIQVADLLTGAINAAHDLFLNNNKQLNIGKKIFIEKFAEILGWDYLHYDTYPEERFNIWHFPEAYRRKPATRVIRCRFDTKYVYKDDVIGK